MIRQNLFWKLFALAAAIGLWSYVNAERNPQSRKTFTVPIEARNLAKGYIAEFVDGKEAAVTLHGPQKIVDSVRKEDVSAWVNVPNRGAGNGTVDDKEKVHARVSGVAQNELDVTVSPSKVRLKTEAIRLNRLPVEVKFLSPPPLGYSYSEPRIEPSSVAISGKTSSVSRVKKAIIGISGEQDSRVIDDDFKVLPVDAKGNVVRNVNLDVETVHLKLRFVEAPATKLVIVSPTLLGQPKFPAVVTRVTVKPSTVTLEGRPAVLMGLSTVSTEPVQIDDIEETVSKDVTLRVPGFARLLGRRNVRVTVYVTSPKSNVVKPR